MNIEQIKKDWEVYCLDNGYRPYIFGLNDIEINLSTQDENGFKINIGEENRITIKANGKIEIPTEDEFYRGFFVVNPIFKYMR